MLSANKSIPNKNFARPRAVSAAATPLERRFTLFILTRFLTCNKHQLSTSLNGPQFDMHLCYMCILANISLRHRNNLFKTGHPQLFRELNGQEKTTPAVLDARESRKFWNDLWDQPVQHNNDGKWLKQQRTKAESVPQQQGVEQQLKGIWQTGKHQELTRCTCTGFRT